MTVTLSKLLRIIHSTISFVGTMFVRKTVMKKYKITGIEFLEKQVTIEVFTHCPDFRE